MKASFDEGDNAQLLRYKFTGEARCELSRMIMKQTLVGSNVGPQAGRADDLTVTLKRIRVSDPRTCKQLAPERGTPAFSHRGEEERV